MSYITLILIYLSLYGVLLLTGWGLTSLLCEGRNAHYVALLSPIIGIVLLCMLPMYFSFLGVNTEWSSRISFSIFLALSLWRISTKPHKMDWNITFGIACLMFVAIIPTWCILVKTGYLTSTFQSYSLFVTAPADYLIKHPFESAIEVDFYKPISNLLHEVSHNKEYFGFFFLLSSISTLTGISSFQIYLLLSSVVTSFIPVSVFIACKEGFKFSNRLALLTAFLCTINYSFYVLHIYGQLPTVLGLTYLILSFGFIPTILKDKKKHDLILYSLLIVGLLSNYWILFPYLVCTYIVFMLINFKFSTEKLLPIKTFLKIGILIVILNPFSFTFLALRGIEILKITSQFTDNIPRYPRIEEVFGLAQHFAVTPHDTFSITLVSSVGLMALGAAILGLYKCFKEDNGLLLSVTLIVLILTCVFLSVDFKYHVYKNLIVGTFPLIALMVMGLDWLYHYGETGFSRISSVIYLISFVALSMSTFLQFSLFDHRVIEESLIGLEELTKSIPSQSTILVDSDIPTEEAWMAFFLKNRNIKLSGAVEPWGFWIFTPFSGKPNSSFFFNPAHDSIDYTLTSRRSINKDIAQAESYQLAFANSAYLLSKGLPNPYLFCGCYPPEQHGINTFRWTKKDIQLLISKSTEDLVFQVSGETPDFFDKPLTVEFRLNDELVERCQSNSGPFSKGCILSKETLTKKYNVFSIRLDRTFCPGLGMNTPDMRQLGMQIFSIGLLPAERLVLSGPIDIGNAEYDKYLLRNWSFSEVMSDGATYKWVDGIDASLAIFLQNPEDMRMEFRAMPLLYPGCSQQEMSVIVNGNKLESMTLSKNYWEVHSVEIPSENLLHGLNNIGLVFSSSASPSQLLENSGDQRNLSVAFDYIKFSRLIAN